MRRQLTLTVLLSSIALGACGTRGPLTLPPPPSKAQPAAASAKASPARADLNTAKESSR